MLLTIMMVLCTLPTVHAAPPIEPSGYEPNARWPVRPGMIKKGGFSADAHDLFYNGGAATAQFEHQQDTQTQAEENRDGKQRILVVF